MDEILKLRERWKTPEQQAILKKLIAERVILKTTQDSIRAINSNFVTSDLRGVDFSTKDVSENFLLCDFDLSFADFSHCILRGSFQASNLYGTSFINSKVIAVHFEESCLDKANFEASVIYDGVFDETQMNGTSFKSAIFHKATFRNTDLTNANIEGAKFGTIDFYRATLNEDQSLYNLLANDSNIAYFDTIKWIPRTA